MAMSAYERTANRWTHSVSGFSAGGTEKVFAETASEAHKLQSRGSLENVGYSYSFGQKLSVHSRTNSGDCASARPWAMAAVCAIPPPLAGRRSHGEAHRCVSGLGDGLYPLVRLPLMPPSPYKLPFKELNNHNSFTTPSVNPQYGHWP
jgi:hypothetical protein